MTKKGKAAAVEATLNAPRTFQCGDFVSRNKLQDNDPKKFCVHLYKVI